MVAAVKVDSNVTGLRYAEEKSFKVLPTTPIWIPQEPDSYADFGGSVTTVARNPINPSRQRKKGVVTDLDASGGYNTDITQTNLQDLLQGYFFADLRRKNDIGDDRQPRRFGLNGEFEDYTITDIDTTADEITVDSRVAVSAVPVAQGATYAVDDIVEVTDANGTILARFRVASETGGAVDTVDLVNPATIRDDNDRTNEGRTELDTSAGAVTTGVSTGFGGDDNLTLTLTYGNGLVWQAGDLLWMQGNDDSGNNGEFTVASVSDNVISVNENLVTDNSPNAAATLTTVGFDSVAGDLDVDVTGALPAIDSSALDFTTLGLVEGEWIFVGGDTGGAAGNQFLGATNNGFKRIRSIAINVLTFDKSDATMVTETNTAELVRLYFGRVLKNETGTSIVRRTYNQERQLGAPDEALLSEIQAEYLEGAVPSEASLNIPQADKMTVDLSFVAGDSTTIDGPTPLKSGTRPALVETDAFNTSSDYSRIKMAQVVAGDEAPTALFAFATEMTITINNNISPNKAIGTLGAFEVTAGTFQVGGSITAYFADVAAVAAVRNNVDITLDIAMVKANAGIVMDLPLITLGDGRPNVAQDESITLPLTMEAATAAKVDAALDYTMMMVFFDRLPNAADT